MPDMDAAPSVSSPQRLPTIVAGAAHRRIAALDRRQILDVTRRCLTELGYEATTIRRIASKLNCSVGSIYRFFQDKRSLLNAVAQSVFEPIATAAEAGVSVAECEQRYRHVASESGHIYRLMFWLACVDDESESHLPRVIARLIDTWTQQLGDLERARKRWVMLHGSVLLDDTAVIATPSQDHHEHRRVVISKLRPLPAPSTPSHATPAAGDDICLL